MKIQPMNSHQNNQVAFITGVTGQIGSYLAEYLLNIGYSKVIGVARRVSNPNTERINCILLNPNFLLEQGDITCPFSLSKLFSKHINNSDLQYEIYNLAALSHVHTSFSQPQAYAHSTGLGHLNLLETLLPYHNYGKNIKVYFQGSSEVFGGQKSPCGHQTIETKMFPNSPYAAAKLYAFHMNRIYRESYGMKNSSGIIFNTESPRRGADFVTRKITQWFAYLALCNYNLEHKLQMGNINACRDWTHAKDSVKAIHLICTADRPKDYIVASGETHSVYNFMEECYNQIQVISGRKCNKPLEDLYEINKNFIRPNEVPYLKGEASEIRKELGWKPQFTFKQLVCEMLKNDYITMREMYD